MKQSTSEEKEMNKLFIVISNKEYGIELNDIIESAFKGIKNSTNIARHRIILPQTIDSIEFLRKYLNIVLAIRKKGKDCFYSQLFDVFELLKLIDISIELKDNEITNTLIENKLKLLITKENCLFILLKYTQLKSHTEFNSTQNLINYCLGLSAKNLNEIMVLSNRNIGDDYDRNELMRLPDNIFLNILSQYFKDHTHIGYDHTLIFQFLMRKRKIQNNDIFTLLDQQRTYTINSFQNEIGDNNSFDHLRIEWILCNCCFKGDFLKESDVYYHNSLNLKLSCYYEYRKDEYSVALHITHDNNKPLKDICVLTNCNLNGIGDIDSINLSYIDMTVYEKKLIFRLNNVIMSSKKNSSKVTLIVDLSVEYILPAIIQHISQKLYMYYILPSISKISRKTLWRILKNKCLYLRSEDEVLTAILNWMKNKSNLKEESLFSLFSVVKWNEISTDNLIELITSYSRLLIALPQLDKLIKEEFHRRLKEEYTHSESTNSFTNEFINKLIKQSMKNGHCFQQINPIKNNNNNTSLFHTTDNTMVISRNNISTHDYLNSCSHAEEPQSTSVVTKNNSSLIRQMQNNITNHSFKKIMPVTSIKPDINVSNATSELNDGKQIYHKKNKSLCLELNLLTNSSCWANTSISKRNETTQLKTQLDIIEKKINQSKHNKNIRHYTTNKYTHSTFKSPNSKQMKQNQYTSSKTFINFK